MGFLDTILSDNLIYIYMYTYIYIYIYQKGTLWRSHFYGALNKSLKNIFGHYIIKCSLF